MVTAEVAPKVTAKVAAEAAKTATEVEAAEVTSNGGRGSGR